MSFKAYAKIVGSCITLRTSVMHEFDTQSVWGADEAREFAAYIVELSDKVERDAAKVDELVTALKEIDVAVCGNRRGVPTWEEVARGLIDKGYSK